MVVIIETHTEPINPPSASPILTHAQFWDGVVYGLRNNHLLVPTINAAKILSHTDEELVLLQTLDEHSTIGHHAGEHRNRFALSPPSKFDGADNSATDFHCLGIIAQGPGGEKDLYFTISYEWNEKGTERGSVEHEEKKKNNHHPRDWARAFIENTRKMVKNGEL